MFKKKTTYFNGPDGLGSFDVIPAGEPDDEFEAEDPAAWCCSC